MWLRLLKIFGVPLKTLADIAELGKGIDLGKYEAVWTGTKRDMCQAVMDAIGAILDAFVAKNSHLMSDKPSDLGINGQLGKSTSISDVSIPVMALHSDESPIVQSVSIHEKPSSYVGATGVAISEPSKPKANFRSLSLQNLCQGAEFYIPRKVVETGFFFFQFKTSKGLEDVLENGPWMIRNSPIILKKWTMNTRLCKEELTRILVWVKIHDVPIQMCIESWGRSRFACCLVEINANDVLKESLTMGVSLIDDSGFTIEIVSIEYEWKPPRCDLCKIFGHVQDHCPKKVSVPSKVVTPTVGGHSVKQTVRYEPKATTSVPKKGATILSNTSKLSSMLKNQPSKVTAPSTKEGNITMSNSYAALDDETDEDVYDESANLLYSTHTGGSLSTFTVAAG
ncbi:zinc knuckle CX2CX4HX4C containing protein [Tanacetum coccineum]